MRRRRFVKTVAGATAIGVAGCTGDGGTTDDGSDGQGTTVGTTEQTLDVEVFLAGGGSLGLLSEIILGEGIDRANGIRLNPQRGSPPQGAQVLKNRGVNVGFFQPENASKSIADGDDIRLFGPMLKHNASLLVRPDTPYESWQDLKGETVGTMPAATGTYQATQLRLALDGIEFREEYDLREAGPGPLFNLARQGELPALVHFPPLSIRLVANGTMNQIEAHYKFFIDEVGTNIYTVGLAGWKDWIDANSEAARRLRQTLVDGERTLLDNTDEMIEKYRETAGYQSDEALALAKEAHPFFHAGKWDQEERDIIRFQIQKAQEIGILSSDTPVDIFADL